jgi:hypothetical protein
MRKTLERVRAVPAMWPAALAALGVEACIEVSQSEEIDRARHRARNEDAHERFVIDVASTNRGA